MSTSHDAKTLEGDSPFHFVGEALALDLVNTTVVVRRKPIDVLASPGAYVAWWDAAAARYPELANRLPVDAIPDPDLLPSVIELRGALRAIFSAVADGTVAPSGALGILNRVLAGVSDAIASDAHGSLRPVLVPGSRDVDGPMAAVARSALIVLTELDHARLHRCANEHCVLLYYDTTRSATRRWCSTDCMNRARSSERYRAKVAARNAALT